MYKHKVVVIGLLSLLLLSFIVQIAYSGVEFVRDDDGIITIPDSASLDIDGTVFSFSVWVKPYFTQYGPSYDTIFDKERTTTATGYLLNFHSGYDDWVFMLGTTGGAISCPTTNLTWSAGDWHHIAGTYSGSQMKIYWDGELENTCGPQTGYGIATNNDPLTIGERNNETFGFDGVINELAIWEATLNQAEITLLAKSKVKRMPLQIQPSSLRGYWPLDDEEDGSSADGDTFVDRSGNGNDGIGKDGTNNTGLTAKAEEVLSYP